LRRRLGPGSSLRSIDFSALKQPSRAANGKHLRPLLRCLNQIVFSFAATWAVAVAGAGANPYQGLLYCNLVRASKNRLRGFFLRLKSPLAHARGLCCQSARLCALSPASEWQVYSPAAATATAAACAGCSNCLGSHYAGGLADEQCLFRASGKAWLGLRWSASRTGCARPKRSSAFLLLPLPRLGSA